MVAARRIEMLLPLFACLVFGPSQVVADPPDSLDGLLKVYRDLGLPLPPKEAKLVRYEAGGGGLVNGKVQATVYALGFELKPETESKNPILLSGTHRWQPSWNPHTREVAPEPDAIKDLPAGMDSDLVLGIQCHARGWDGLARYLLERNSKEDKTPVRPALIKLAWYHWVGQLTQAKTDRAPVARRLRELIGQDKELDTDENRMMLKSLDLALVPSKAKPGSVEALIDDLVDYNADTGTIGIFEPEDRYWRIAKLGFDAVPALIEHLGDDRLTRAQMMGFNNFRSWQLRVGDVVGDLLEGLAGQEVGRDWLRRQQGYGVEKAEAAKWWERARKVGEEVYLLDHVMPAEVKEGGAAHVSAHLLHVIVAKYPRHIPTLYRTVLDKRPDVDSGMLAGAVLRSKMPDKEKLDLFLHAVKHKDRDHRLPALYAIRELDRKQFNSLLLAAIESIPTDVEGPYWTCPEAHTTTLAIGCDDPRVWPALEKAAKNAVPGFRMELLNHFSDPMDSRHKRERLQLLASFLDDDASRDCNSSGKFEGPCAGFFYHKLEVRNFAALEIGALVRIDIPLDPDRSPDEWAKVRSRVNDALKRELKAK